MKELEKQIGLTDKVITEQVAPKFKHIGKLKFRRGMKLYKCDITSRVIEEVEMEGVATMSGALKYKVEADENCMSCTALNMKNAKRKFVNQFREMVKGISKDDVL